MKYLINSILFLSLSLVACENQSQTKSTKTPESTKESKALEAIFPKGDKGSADLFVGDAFHYGMVSPDSIYTSAVGNVHFKPGARSNWHSHASGQILIITGGVGYHQIEGQPKETIRKGDVVKCPPNVNHWHGASEDKGLQQIYIVPNTEKGVVTWNDAVTDKEYRK